MNINQTYDQLVAQNLGKPVEREDPSNLDQCFDWAFAYVDALGIPRSAIRHLRAYEIWTLATDETRKYFDLIPNSATFVPQKGDMAIFGTEVGVSGHVCLADGNGDINKFQSTDQNWNGHLYIEYIWHTYGGINGLLGVLRPKQTTQGGGGMTDTDKAVGFDRGLIAAHNAGLIQTEDSNKATPDTLAQAITNLKADRDHQAGNATKWDQVCHAVGLQGDSSQITVQQVLVQMKPISRMAELEQIRDIAIKALS